METKLYNDDFILDLSGQKIQIQESNSRLNSKTFTKFTFPFEIGIDEKFIHAIGDYSSPEIKNLKKEIPCYLTYENKISEAVLKILKVKGKNLTGQVNFGLEEIPNFDKKLAELPLEKFDVSDIHTYAKDICAKKYPETNFNFPRMYTTKYSPDSEVWSAFDGYYNDLKPDGSEMRRNYLDPDLNIFNVNIIHPCPYWLYLLKAGFEEKGYTLAGEILSDPDVYQRCVFSGTEYFGQGTQFKYFEDVSSLSYDSVKWIHYYYEWINGMSFERFVQQYEYSSTENLNFQDQVKVIGKFKAKIKKNTKLVAEIRLGGNIIWSDEAQKLNDTEIEFPFNLTLNVNHQELKFYVRGCLYSIAEMYNVIEYELKSDSIVVKENGTPTESLVIENPNKINLQRAVPDITFGELVNRTINWLNYDIGFYGKTITMNRLDKDPENVKDFRPFEINEPEITFLAKKSFLIKFADLDNGKKKNSMFYDANGPLLNGAAKTDTTTIEIDGYAMPVELAKPNGYTTAIVQRDSDSTLAVVYYDGLIDGQNNAKNPPGCDFPELFPKNWEKFLRQRISGNQISDEFYVYIKDFAEYGIKDYVYYHNNIYQFDTWTKEMINNEVYKVNYTAESVS